MGSAPVTALQCGVALQKAINAFGGTLVVDGKPGSATIDALNALDRLDRLMLDNMLIKEIGMGARNAVVGERGYTVPPYNYLRKQDCDVLLVKACRLLGVSQLAETFKDFLYMEAGQRIVRGEVYYNVLSRNGRSRGLSQFQPPAWSDARKKALEINPDLDIGSYEEGVYLPANNLVACVAYTLGNIEIMQDRYPEVPINGETLYLSHNQGPHFWRTLKGINISGQSRTARPLIAKYQKLLG